MSLIKSYPEKLSKLSNHYVHQRFSVGQFAKVKVSNGQATIGHFGHSKSPSSRQSVK